MNRLSAVLMGVLVVAGGFLPGPAAAPKHPTAARKSAAPRAAAPPVSADSSEQAWSEALKLSDEKRYDESLARLRKALDRDPSNVDLRWLEAEVLGWSDRHAESVARFESLVRDHPELAADVAVELGTERLWSGDPRGALRDAEAALADEPDNNEAQRLRALALAHSDQYAKALAAYDELLARDPDDVDLAVDRATVLGWSGRNAEAAAAYAKILEAHPDNTRARVGLAENENWQGNHRRAAGMFRKLIDAGHDDPEVLKGMAYASYWDEDPETARAVLNRYTAAAPDDREARNLSRTIRLEQDQAINAGYEASSDSDDLKIRTTTLDYRLPLPQQTAFLALYRDDHVEDPGGVEHPRRFGVGVEKRWADRWKANALAFYYDPRNDGGTEVLGQAELTYRPSDRLRCDFGFEMEPVLTRLSLSKNIESNNLSASVTGRVAERVSLTGRGLFRDFNDGNQAQQVAAEARWDLNSRRRSRLALLFGAEYLSMADDLDNGYYDPSSYLELGPGVEGTIEFANQCVLGAEVRAGVQQEQGSSSEFFYKLVGIGKVPLGKSLRLVLEAGASNSSLSSASGFKQTRGAVYLTAAF